MRRGGETFIRAPVSCIVLSVFYIYYASTPLGVQKWNNMFASITCNTINTCTALERRREKQLLAIKSFARDVYNRVPVFYYSAIRRNKVGRIEIRKFLIHICSSHLYVLSRFQPNLNRLIWDKISYRAAKPPVDHRESNLNGLASFFIVKLPGEIHYFSLSIESFDPL